MKQESNLHGHGFNVMLYHWSYSSLVGPVRFELTTLRLKAGYILPIELRASLGRLCRCISRPQPGPSSIYIIYSLFCCSLLTGLAPTEAPEPRLKMSSPAFLPGPENKKPGRYKSRPGFFLLIMLAHLTMDKLRPIFFIIFKAKKKEPVRSRAYAAC